MVTGGKPAGRPFTQISPYNPGDVSSRPPFATGAGATAGSTGFGFGSTATGSILRFKPRQIGKFRLEYPSPEITARQMIAAPMELLGAAGIIYFALPAEGNPGFFVVLAVFLASFSAGLVSNAPGGLGVFELVFIKALPTLAKSKVLAALLVFRLFYLLIPLAIALVVVILFERQRLMEVIRDDAGGETKS